VCVRERPPAGRRPTTARACGALSLSLSHTHTLSLRASVDTGAGVQEVITPKWVIFMRLLTGPMPSPLNPKPRRASVDNGAGVRRSKSISLAVCVCERERSCVCVCERSCVCERKRERS